MNDRGFGGTLISAAVGAALVAIAGNASAAGFAIGTQNASGLGNAYAGAAATAEDASTIWYNPAGMTRLPGRQAVGSLNALKPETKFSSDYVAYHAPPADHDRPHQQRRRRGRLGLRAGWVPLVAAHARALGGDRAERAVRPHHRVGLRLGRALSCDQVRGAHDQHQSFHRVEGQRDVLGRRGHQRHVHRRGADERRRLQRDRV